MNGLHYASVGRVVWGCLEVYQAMLFLSSRFVWYLSPTARRYTAIEPKCDEDLAWGVAKGIKMCSGPVVQEVQISECGGQSVPLTPHTHA
jgi:hypothetical protein